MEQSFSHLALAASAVAFLLPLLFTRRARRPKRIPPPVVPPPSRALAAQWHRHPAGKTGA